MQRAWRRVKCLILGCNHGEWVPMAHESEWVQAYLRQCKRCLRMSKEAFLMMPRKADGGGQ